ncbi:MAG: outer membrane lipoprotein carrier protein LolA [bacterium]|nr:outer membrane lipoprotein carrier protein LolA [bacterium]
MNRCISRVRVPGIKFQLMILGVFFLLPGSNLYSAQKDSTNAHRQIAKVRTALNRIRPFKVDFIQQVYSDEQLDIQESGEIIFKDERRLKWTYLDPDYKVFLLDGENYKFYDEDNEQLMVGKVKEKNRQWIWQLLFSDEILPHARWDELVKTLRVEDDARDIDIEIQINNDFLPVKVNQGDPSGARMVYHFKKYRKNITLTSETLQLKVPEDVEIIRE